MASRVAALAAAAPTLFESGMPPLVSWLDSRSIGLTARQAAHTIRPSPIMSSDELPNRLVSSPPGRLLWRDLYSEAELYKCAVRLYTKPLFSWRKALIRSTDRRDLYDFARRGPQNLDAIHRALRSESFAFRPGMALHRIFGGKHRTLYVYPWEERLVDLFLYRMLSTRLHNFLSANSYAYRIKGFGLDRCQRKIAHLFAAASSPFFVMKRDIASYFPSIDHELLLDQLRCLVPSDDYLFHLLESRVRFHFVDKSQNCVAARGIPFGTPIACFFANLYLTPLDRRLDAIPRLHYFRYADDVLFFSEVRPAVESAVDAFQQALAERGLSSKPSHELEILLSLRGPGEPGFPAAPSVRHLGLEFQAGGRIRLSRDKFRKITNLFRFAFRRKRAKLARIADFRKRAQFAISLAQSTLDANVRNVSIIDYYLKHVNDEAQLRLLDRWLAEEVLSIAFCGGHKKGYFRQLPYTALRAMGLPSLVHRRRQIQHGQVEAPFFVWKSYQRQKSSRETAVRLRPLTMDAPAFSPSPEAVT